MAASRAAEGGSIPSVPIRIGRLECRRARTSHLPKMKIKIRYNSSVPRFFGFEGITLYPFVFMNKSEKEAKKTKLLHHEWIHVKQIQEEGFFRFYLSYIFQIFFNLFRYGNLKKAYKNISYEKEAYLDEKRIKLPKELV